MSDAPVFPVTPYRDQIIVRVIKNITKSKILMPDTAKSRLGAEYGVAVACGPGLLIPDGPLAGQRLPMEVAVDDVVMFREYGGTPFKHGGEQFRLVQMDDAVAGVDLDTFEPTARLKDSSDGDLPGLGGGKQLIVPR